MKAPFSAVVAALAAAPSVLLLLASKPAIAIPAWARKYNLQCANCHVAGGNRPTRLGKDFLLRGHRSAEDGAKDSASEWRFADYSGLATKWSLSSGREGDAQNSATTLRLDEVALISGVPLTKNLAAFLTWSLSEDADSRLGPTYLTFVNNPQSNEFWYTRAGRFQPMIIVANGLGTARTGVSAPLTTTGDLGSGNGFTLDDVSAGVSAGFVTKDRLTGEVGVVGGQEDEGRLRNVFATIEKEFDEQGSALGVYVYSGHRRTVEALIHPHPALPLRGGGVEGTARFILRQESRLARYGLIGSYGLGSFTVSGSYVIGRDELPGGGTREPQAYHVQGEYHPSPMTVWYARYEQLMPGSSGLPRVIGIVGGASFRLWASGRLAVEGANVRKGGSDSGVLRARLVWVF